MLKEKYLKYKLKYLTVKKLYGGSNRTPITPVISKSIPISKKWKKKIHDDELVRKLDKLSKETRYALKAEKKTKEEEKKTAETLPPTPILDEWAREAEAAAQGIAAIEAPPEAREVVAVLADDTNKESNEAYVFEPPTSIMDEWERELGVAPAREVVADQYLQRSEVEEGLEEDEIEQGEGEGIPPPAPGIIKYRGVRQEATGKWTARIFQNGITSYLGTFDTPEDAADAYNEAKKNNDDAKEAQHGIEVSGPSAASGSTEHIGNNNLSLIISQKLQDHKYFNSVYNKTTGNFKYIDYHDGWRLRWHENHTRRSKNFPTLEEAVENLYKLIDNGIIKIKK